MRRHIFSRIDKFVIGIALAVLLAFYFPEWGATDSPFPLGQISRWGIALIFFFYGLKLSIKDVRSGLANWKLHLLIQTVTFLLFPLLILAAKPLFSTENQQVWLSFFFLAALPSTVSSSVVMVSIARGNIPAAIFNASLSGLIGIAITPLWIGLFVQTTDNFDFGGVYRTLMIDIVIPLIIGLLLQRFLHRFAIRYRVALATFDKSVILLIVYTSFAESFSEGVFQLVSWLYLIGTSVGVVVLFFLVYSIVVYLCRLLRFTEPDSVTALFCGSKKSLTHGVVFSQALFGTAGHLGLLLFPLMLFHTFQIFVISAIASRKNRPSV